MGQAGLESCQYRVESEGRWTCKTRGIESLRVCLGGYPQFWNGRRDRSSKDTEMESERQKKPRKMLVKTE